MHRVSLFLGIMALALVPPPLAHAHFLWLAASSSAESPQIKVYFGETAEPDDPDLLDRVQAAELWAIPSRGEPQRLELTKGDDALEAQLTGSSAPTAFVLRHTYGVASRGDATFLLKYYAKTYPSPLPGTWRSVRDEERLPLEITPHVEGNEVVLRVLWKGKPAPNSAVAVEGPGVSEEGTTDEAGVYRFAAKEAGAYSIRARLIETTAGEHAGKAYSEQRHYSTLTLPYAPSKLAPVAHDMPALPRGTTSIGAAIANDVLYVYGGNYGDAHEYSNAGQSGDLWKLDLKQPAAWQPAPGGPKLQGLALVAHDGKLYRVGGFTAMNDEGEPSDLQSQASFAQFDPDKQAWSDLAPLPEPRSSHDAAVLEGKLYVVGGWALAGNSSEAHWHETAWVCDLTQPNPSWKAIANPPFHRRALALAAHNGKLYCLGGMQREGGPTRRVAIYDPATDSWSEGPQLLGEPMDGFGSSAFACGGDLYVSTISGAIQRLSDSGEAWHYLGQLDHPRFFHRLLAWNDKLIAVGGGSMSVGKIEDVELIPVAAR